MERELSREITFNHYFLVQSEPLFLFYFFFPDEKAGGSKRSNPRDHQDCINSVDSNSQLEIFCSAR